MVKRARRASEAANAGRVLSPVLSSDPHKKCARTLDARTQRPRRQSRPMADPDLDWRLTELLRHLIQAQLIVERLLREVAELVGEPGGSPGADEN
jgi:hypothetical protein